MVQVWFQKLGSHFKVWFRYGFEKVNTKETKVDLKAGLHCLVVSDQVLVDKKERTPKQLLWTLGKTL